MKSFCFETRVEFCQTDAAGIAHFSALMQYVEQAEHAFLRSLGLSVFSRSPGAITWPRVKVTAEFLGPAYFEEVLTIEVIVERIGTSSVTYSSTIRRQSCEIAKCQTICVCCTHSAESHGVLVKTSIPDGVREKLCAFLA